MCLSGPLYVHRLGLNHGVEFFKLLLFQIVVNRGYHNYDSNSEQNGTTLQPAVYWLLDQPDYERNDRSDDQNSKNEILKLVPDQSAERFLWLCNLLVLAKSFFTSLEVFIVKTDAV